MQPQNAATSQFGGGLSPATSAASIISTVDVANPPNIYVQQSSLPTAPTAPPPTVVAAAAAATATTTTYSHNSKTTRDQTNEWQQSPLPPPADNNEDLSAINEHGDNLGGFNGVGGGTTSGSGNFGIGNGHNNFNTKNNTQTTCYYFAPSRHNSIYEHPSAVGYNSPFQFDPSAATTAAAAAAVESLRRSNSILLRNSSCAKALNQNDGTGGGLDTPTSLNSAMDMGSNSGASACCSNCCVGPPPVLFLFVTLLMTTSATAMLCAAIMTDHWEHVTWDRNSLDRYTNRSNMQLEWMLDEKVAMLKPDKKAEYRFRRETVFLVPMHGGIWTLCIDLPMQELQELRRHPKFPRGAPPCVNYLAGSMENARGEEQRNDWQHSESQTSLQPHLSTYGTIYVYS
ncbi:unnamed protein product [Ceratitis capitata]|uniref:(Mediterranean fruit fly) hypothetical protein n=1 Tax=Ceratitis capitata TaxID=7213 RepID=A0A811TX69_CERCA|nr:unnamed protein product [Ceratitis capitata]